MQRYQPTANNPKSSGTEGFQRAIGKPFGRLRRGETPATKQIKQHRKIPPN